MKKTENTLDILGNKNRRKILQLLSEKPMYVTEISQKLQTGRKAIIDHLKILENHGLIKSYRQGNKKYYKIKNSLILQIIINKNTNQIQIENLELNENDKKQVRTTYPEIERVERKKHEVNQDFRQLLTLIRETEEQCKKIHKTEKRLYQLIDELMQTGREIVDKKVTNQKEKTLLLEMMKEGQVRPEELSKKHDIQIDEIYETVKKLRQKDIL
ncbi:metalloregulator ArsR/SmtB family transcription factor [Methanonatronarchaeum sp. AMET6-2]|uniref:ArsR/SmtB family transcription factor n=1 Tax=Methanonatronarchaeum sp. AMET6-2 TaxID=2933293 RepID=UPI001FF21E4B|nr:metalloregulator ArsR/SmtB family transcription factor [Methanonatronarchaeum sp. AMET6-2]UOY10392.1 metalloregulator ArsR/SmtB family transcription factor [Methanonatronarchaeum sp. AMET6-2]